MYGLISKLYPVMAAILHFPLTHTVACIKQTYSIIKGTLQLRMFSNSGFMCVVYSSIAGAYKMCCACMCIVLSRTSITNVCIVQVEHNG